MILAIAAQQALSSVTLAMQEIDERNHVIQSTTAEQTQVAHEIDRNLVNIRNLSLQSAEGVQQITIATRSLAELATGLNVMIGHFPMR